MASPRIAVEIDEPMPSNVNSACTTHTMAIKMEPTEKTARKFRPRLQRIGTNVGAYR